MLLAVFRKNSLTQVGVIKMIRIAVEEALQDIQQALQQKGHEIDEKDNTYDIVVVRSLEEYSDLPVKASLVGVDGMSTDEVFKMVEERINLEK